MQGLDLLKQVDVLVEWSEKLEKRLKTIENKLLSLQQQIWQIKR